MFRRTMPSPQPSPQPGPQTSPQTGPRGHRRARLAVAVAATAGLTALGSPLLLASAMMIPGTPWNDVHVGGDDDNETNTRIQPRGVTTPLHMDNADVIFGRERNDLLIGRTGADTLIAGDGDDILVGGPDIRTRNRSDIAIGDAGNDVNIWAPGDGNDAFVALTGYDTQVLAPFTAVRNGSPVLSTWAGRKVPKVKIDGQPAFSCTLHYLPASTKAGYQYIVRFLVSGAPVASVRLRDTERVLCPHPTRGWVRVARLVGTRPTFVAARLSSITGLPGAVLAR